MLEAKQGQQRKFISNIVITYFFLKLKTKNEKLFTLFPYSKRNRPSQWYHENFIYIVIEFFISIDIKSNIISSKFSLRTAAAHYLDHFFKAKKIH